MIEAAPVWNDRVPMRVVTNPSADWWFDVTLRSDAATFFHTPIWSEIGRSCFHGIDRTLGFEFRNGVRAVLPIMETGRHRRRPILESTVAGCYGGLVSTAPLDRHQLRAIRLRLTAFGYHTFEYLESPLGADGTVSDGTDSLGLRGARSRLESAWLIDLDPDFDTVFHRFQPRLRTHYRSGVAKGVKVELGTSIDDYRAHYEAYREAVGRWGEDDDYGYDWSVFERIHDVSGRYPDNIKLWVADVDGEAVGGRLVFYWQGHAALWHGSVRSEYLNHHVVPVLDIEIARDAARAGLDAYDLNTTGDLPGVIEYKRRFRSREVPLRIWSHESVPFRAVRSAKGRLGR